MSEDANLAAPPTCLIGQDITKSLPWKELFHGAPVEVDIGCGMGHFMLARAAEHPEIEFIGIERLLPRVRSIDKRVFRGGLTNVRLVRLEAAYVFRWLIPESSISRAYLLFPDPWPKRRHHDRRLFNAEFRDLIHSRLIPGGELQVATDHLDYFAEIAALMRADERFVEVPADVRGENQKTAFERIFLAQNLPVGAGGWKKL